MGDPLDRRSDPLFGCRRAFPLSSASPFGECGATETDMEVIRKPRGSREPPPLDTCGAPFPPGGRRASTQSSSRRDPEESAPRRPGRRPPRALEAPREGARRAGHRSSNDPRAALRGPQAREQRRARPDRRAPRGRAGGRPTSSAERRPADARRSRRSGSEKGRRGERRRPTETDSARNRRGTWIRHRRRRDRPPDRGGGCCRHHRPRPPTGPSKPERPGETTATPDPDARPRRRPRRRTPDGRPPTADPDGRGATPERDPEAQPPPPGSASFPTATAPPTLGTGTIRARIPAVPSVRSFRTPDIVDPPRPSHRRWMTIRSDLATVVVIAAAMTTAPAKADETGASAADPRATRSIPLRERFKRRKGALTSPEAFAEAIVIWGGDLPRASAPRKGYRVGLQPSARAVRAVSGGPDGAARPRISRRT